MAAEKPRSVNKDFLYLSLIIILIAFLAFTVTQNSMDTGARQVVKEDLKRVYGLLTGNDVEVLTLTDEGNVYKILLRLKLPGGDVLREVYTTKDGRFFAEADNVFEVSKFLENLEREKEFAECLDEKGLLVFGRSNEPNTVQQLLVIGNFAKKVYVDCAGANLQACQQLGVEKIPTIVYNNKSYAGLKPRNWLINLTGCEF